jgi:hypothetical protein
MNALTSLPSNHPAILRLVFALSFWFCLAIAQPSEAFAAVLPQYPIFANIQDTQLLNQQDPDLGAAAEQTKQASKDVFQGLEQAKKEVGKTQTRKQAMDYGHQKASDKLEELAERAEAAQTPEDLNPADRMFLKNLREED